MAKAWDINQGEILQDVANYCEGGVGVIDLADACGMNLEQFQAFVGAPFPQLHGQEYADRPTEQDLMNLILLSFAKMTLRMLLKQRDQSKR